MDKQQESPAPTSNSVVPATEENTAVASVAPSPVTAPTPTPVETESLPPSPTTPPLSATTSIPDVPPTPDTVIGGDRTSVAASEKQLKRDTIISTAPSTNTTESMVTVRLSDNEVPSMPSPTPTLKLVDDKSEEYVLTSGKPIMFASERTESPAPMEAPASGRSSGSETQRSVDWAGLEKTEGVQSSETGTAFLLARLEQENNRLAQDPKAAHPERPPDMAKLRKLMDSPDPNTLRYSMLPAPPPLTDLDFYAALVSDYSRAARKLPNLLSKKIRGGVPPPLRGVVWIAMSGARDCNLEGLYDQLLGETSPYEQLIGKDVGRTGLEMFKQDGSEEQRMLGRVLRAFSIYDTQIGYCQGLGFLVGPLLMHMGEKEAFCVLVRLMEYYDLRSCFLPDLCGLRLRMYQFTQLLAQHFPELSSHLHELGIQPTYASQWFLSFFAVSCPLPMLFRIYDVIFAEGAPETMMRVALSLMKRNEKRLLNATEFEDVMQMLLSRSLWDTYKYNADDLVQDFVSYSSIVTRDKLVELQKNWESLGAADEEAKLVPTKSQFTELQATASRFLGRLWGGTTSVNLSPASVQSRRASRMSMHRTPSKQSLSTISSFDTGSGSPSPSASTDATSISRGSSVAPNERRLSGVSISSMRKANNRDGELHGQIEDLLVALSTLQREHAVKMEELRTVKTSRDEERELTKRLVELLGAGSVDEEESITEISDLCDIITERFDRVEAEEAAAAEYERDVTTRLTEELSHTKELLDRETSKTKSLTSKLSDADAEISRLKSQLLDARTRCTETQKENQNLQKSISELKNTQSGGPRFHRRGTSTDSNSPKSPESMTSPSPFSSARPAASGLRELRLGRTATSPTAVPLRSPTFSKRTSSLGMHAILTSTADQAPAPEEQLLMELVASKTAEAVARQEAEEAKQKLETLRKVLGGTLTAPVLAQTQQAVSGGGGGGFPFLSPTTTGQRKEAVTAPATPSAQGGWFSPWMKRSQTSLDSR
ncbi:hypothetical protein EX30DRAFT_167557 [Ascodesmis nigricans]|uniref:Rab-GAP TBC domain-containing protein n=1 Tax=Ascodesmis nigricans TaxID=341454 RepID=A0A4S2MM22_9PEZI|nr:hypothetical protein EX30DRAFT_167557 [Ascodesmis nigricans]